MRRKPHNWIVLNLIPAIQCVGNAACCFQGFEDTLTPNRWYHQCSPPKTFLIYSTTKNSVCPWPELNKVHWEGWLPGQKSTSITQWEVAPTEGKHGSVRESLVGGGAQISTHNEGNDIREIHLSLCLNSQLLTKA